MAQAHRAEVEVQRLPQPGWGHQGQPDRVDPGRDPHRRQLRRESPAEQRIDRLADHAAQHQQVAGERAGSASIAARQGEQHHAPHRESDRRPAARPEMLAQPDMTAERHHRRQGGEDHASGTRRGERQAGEHADREQEVAEERLREQQPGVRTRLGETAAPGQHQQRRQAEAQPGQQEHREHLGERLAECGVAADQGHAREEQQVAAKGGGGRRGLGGRHGLAAHCGRSAARAARLCLDRKDLSRFPDYPRAAPAASLRG